MFLKINSHRARDRVQSRCPVEVIDYHYYSDRWGILHIAYVPDETDISNIKSVKVVKRPKEELFESWKIPQV